MPIDLLAFLKPDQQELFSKLDCVTVCRFRSLRSGRKGEKEKSKTS
jgi:hypothetical protein